MSMNTCMIRPMHWFGPCMSQVSLVPFPFGSIAPPSRTSGHLSGRAPT